MYTAEAFEYDEIGKIDLTNIYDRPDPRSYYTTLRRLKYMIPETAKPVFQNVIDAYRSIRNKRKVRIVDVGCSYGINAAMLKGDLEMDQLYSLYTAEGTKTARKDQLLARDRSFMNDVVKDEDLEVVGHDASASAIKYAVEAKLLDDGVAADLETAPPSPEVAAVLDDTDLVVQRIAQLIHMAARAGTQYIICGPADHGDKSDPRLFISEDHVPLWLLHPVKQLASDTGGHTSTFAMCAYGGSRQDYTVLLYSPGLAAQLGPLDRGYCSHPHHAKAPPLASSPSLTPAFTVVVADALASPFTPPLSLSPPLPPLSLHPPHHHPLPQRQRQRLSPGSRG